MPIYMRFENNKQIETTTLTTKPKGEEWHEAPEEFSWEKRYCITKGGEIVERSNEDIQNELLQDAKFSALSSLHIYFCSYTNQYTGHSHQKAKSYQIQAKAAENILAAEANKLNEKDTQIVEPLARVRGITVVQMAELIQEKAKKAVKAIAKCEELEDLAKQRIKQATTQKALQDLLNNFEQQIRSSLASL